MPDERLRHLAATAAEWGAEALPLLDPPARVRTEQLVGQAFDRQAADLRLPEEQLRWINHSAGDGVPVVVIPDTPRSEPSLRTRYGAGRLHEAERELGGTDGLLIMRGGSDDIGAWLRTGEGLSALWLQATREGLSVVPLSQVIELDETRQRLRIDVLRRLGFPHILIRVGWQAISRGTVPTTPRRPLDDVLDV